MPTYEENMYQSLRRRGLALKFECAGVYGIFIDRRLVYVGKSGNMLRRMAQHFVGMTLKREHKYQVLAAARSSGHRVWFDVLYYAKSNDIENEIGAKEGELIRRYLPPLNKQIPKAENWHSCTLNAAADTITLQDILK